MRDLNYILEFAESMDSLKPVGYTEGVSNTQRYKALGNGWDIEVIRFIFRNLQ